MSAEIDRRIADHAARQNGVVTRAQLLDAGLHSRTVDRRLATGRLRPLYRGVYLVGPLLPERAREMAAVLVSLPTTTMAFGRRSIVPGVVARHLK